MAKHILTEWERNGYHDSDFYCSYWDDATQSVLSMEVGTTRCAAPTSAKIDGIGEDPACFKMPTLEIVQKAVLWLEGRIAAMIKSADERDVLEPQPNRVSERNTRLRLLEAGEFKDKKAKTVTPYAVGDAGVVIWSGQFGTFYNNGYNKRCRSNTRVGIKLDNGTVIFTELSKCRMDMDFVTDEYCQKRAKELAPNCGFSSGLFGAAWDSRNYALELLNKNKIKSPTAAELMGAKSAN